MLEVLLIVIAKSGGIAGDPIAAWAAGVSKLATQIEKL